MPTSQSTHLKNLIILIHGIGAQRRRETLDSFLTSLRDSSHGANISDPNRVYELNSTEPHVSGSPQTDHYQYYSKTLAFGDKETVVSELHWADMAELNKGLFANFRNFFRLIRDAPDIAYAAIAPGSAHSGRISRALLGFLSGVISFAFWLIYYPIASINLSYAWHILNYSLTTHLVIWYRSLPKDPRVIPLSTDIDLIFYLTSSCAAVFVALFSWFIARPRYQKATDPRFQLRWRYAWVLGLWTSVFIFAPVIVAATKKWLKNEAVTHANFADIMDKILSTTWFAALGGPALYLVLLVPFMLMFYKKRHGLLLGFSTVFAALLFWLAFINTSILTLIYAVSNSAQEEAIGVQAKVSMKFLGLWWYEIGALLALAAISIFAHYIQSRIRLAKKSTNETYPRLLVPTLVLYGSPLLALFLFYTIAGCNKQYPITLPGVTYICHHISIATDYIYANASWMMVLGGLLISILGIALEVMGDVVAFFHSRTNHREVTPWKAVHAAYNYDPLTQRPLPLALNNRAQKLCNDIAERHGSFETITLASHSLGTIVAFDILCKEKGFLSKSPVIRSVSMGSPYSHIFTRYFPDIYSKDVLAKELSEFQLHNLYRANDYVGRCLHFGHGNVTEERLLPEGHFGYFEDNYVCEMVWKTHHGVK